MTPIGALLQLLGVLIDVYQIILLLRVLISWIRLDPYSNPFARILYQLTEPVLEPIRQILPSAGMFDFSPVVAFVVLFALRQVLAILAAGL